MDFKGIAPFEINSKYRGLHIEKKAQSDKIIALAGNPNVGKSTVFNSLTGLNQHTGNWPGKTVMNTQGKYTYRNNNYIIVDMPGTYSLMSNSTEEEIARDFICFGQPDAVVVIADATCLERNLNLLLQIMEMTGNVVLCVNLMDEAGKKKIRINLDILSEQLGIPVVGTSARSKKGLGKLLDAVASVAENPAGAEPLCLIYSDEIETAVSMVEPSVSACLHESVSSRWVSLRLLDADDSLLNSLTEYLGYDIMQDEEISDNVAKARLYLAEKGIPPEEFANQVVERIVKTCENLSRETII